MGSVEVLSTKAGMEGWVEKSGQGPVQKEDWESDFPFLMWGCLVYLVRLPLNPAKAS